MGAVVDRSGKSKMKMKSNIAVAMVIILIAMVTDTNCAPKMMGKTKMEKFSDVAMNGTNDIKDLIEEVKKFIGPCVRQLVQCRKSHGIIGKAICDARLPICVVHSFGCGLVEMPLFVPCLPAILVDPMDPQYWGEYVGSCVCSIEKLTTCAFNARVKEYCKSIEGVL